jgi:SAM-dependent methyltransferase
LFLKDWSYREMIGALPLALLIASIYSSPVLAEPGPATEETAIVRLCREAEALEPLVDSPLAKDFLRTTPELPTIAPRKLFRDESKKTYFTESAVGRLSDEERRRMRLKPIAVDAALYYNTKFGSPLAYARPLDLLGQSGLADVSGRKILDFGYGTVGHLRLLAGLGAEVTGVDVDPMLRVLYGAPEDQGIVKSRRGRNGRVRLIEGRFPADESIKRIVGGSYDLIISKNTLKKGYVHPDRPVDPKGLLGLGIEDTAFIRALYEALKPGGRVMIYNICPAPSPPGQPYKHWADGRCPFARTVWEAVGFRVVAFDHDDSEAIRKIAHALSWDQGDSPIDLKRDLFAQYSLMEKPARP